MKNKTQFLPLFTLIAGIVGLVLRLWLFRTGVDEKGLLVSSHPANTLAFILTALVMVILLLAIKPLEPLGRYQKLFPASIWAAVGCAAAAAGILVSAFYEISLRHDLVTIVTLVLAVLAAASLVIIAICRKQGKRPHFLLQGVITVYLMLHLVSQYRLWSAEPQLQIYFFQLLASVFLMLTTYHGTVLDAQKGSRRWYVFCNQAALFCCCMSLTGSVWPFYLAMGAFCATNVCSLYYKPYQPKYSKENH